MTQFYKFSWRTNVFFVSKRANVCAKFPLPSRSPLSSCCAAPFIVLSLSLAQLIFHFITFSLCGVHGWKSFTLGQETVGLWENDEWGGALDWFKVGTTRKLLKRFLVEWILERERHASFKLKEKFHVPDLQLVTILCNDEGVKVHEVENFLKLFSRCFVFRSFPAQLHNPPLVFSPASVQLCFSTSADVFLEHFVCRRARFFLCCYWLCWEKLRNKGKVSLKIKSNF